MTGQPMSRGGEGGSIVWDIPSGAANGKGDIEEEQRICGTLVLDLDGTLTVPGRKYAVDADAVSVAAEFVLRGGHLIMNSGATRGRMERTLLTPLYRMLDDQVGPLQAEKLFQQIHLMPENGSALLLSAGVSVVENELQFDWYRIHELHVPSKGALRLLIERELMPLRRGSGLAGEHLSNAANREYILSWKDVNDTLELVQYIQKDVRPHHPEIDWSKIALKAARTTIDFVHADSGKTISVAWVLQELAGLAGPVVGLGDLGDEFGRVVPTINVNKYKPNEFRRRGVPAMDLTGSWKLLDEGEYVIVGTGARATVRNSRTDEEISVLRDENGGVFLARRETKTAASGQVTECLVPDAEHGTPMRAQVLRYEQNGQIVEVDDAGKASAWIIKRLLSVGYFAPTETR
jgi:hypothetical protein